LPADKPHPQLAADLIHFAVRLWTLAYFAPNSIEFQKLAIEGAASTELLNTTSRWRMLNYIRMGIFMAVSLVLIPTCIKILNLKARSTPSGKYTSNPASPALSGRSGCPGF
jgi:hypothetical protein